MVRAVSDAVFDDDPLRLLRLPRIAHELGFEIEPATARLAEARRGRAAEPSAERIFMEVRRLIGGDRPAEALRRVDALGVLDVVMPEIAPLRGCLQSEHHQLDVWEHTLHVVEAVADIGDHPGHYLPAHVDRLRGELDAVVGDEMTGRQALRLAALFHDIRKPQTRREVDGRIGFMGHDAQGSQATAAILGRWKASNDLIRFCRMLVRHARPGWWTCCGSSPGRCRQPGLTGRFERFFWRSSAASRYGFYRCQKPNVALVWAHWNTVGGSGESAQN